MPLPTSSLFTPSAAAFAKFPSRRSVVHSTRGIVACPQPLAANCGLEVLRAGGNAAVSFILHVYQPGANSTRMPQSQSVRHHQTETYWKCINGAFIAAGLNMTEPCSTGIGGDMFILFFDAASQTVKAMNGSGRAGAKCTLDAVRRDLGVPEGKAGSIPMDSAHAATVPGAAAGWVDAVAEFGSGRVDMAEILAPAIRLGEEGFPVSEVASRSVSSLAYLVNS